MRGEGVYKAKKGLIRVSLELLDEKIRDITITGDFFLYPEDALFEMEDELKGVPIGQVRKVLSDFYREHQVLSPGLGPDDLAVAIEQAAQDIVQSGGKTA